jgi:hypothetical protein
VNYFPLGLEFPARTQLAMDLLRSQLRVVALDNSIQPQFSPKYSLNPLISQPLPSNVISFHMGHIAESLFLQPLTI